MRSPVRALRLPLGLMGAVVLVTYGAIVWTLPRGFDWTDEAFVYTMIASNRIAIGEPWGFQHLLHPLYALTGGSVLAFRILRLAGYLVLSLALVGCARAVVHRIGISIPRSGWVFILLLAQVGTFLAWSYPPHYLGYNELGSWFAQLGVALIVLSLAWGVSVPEVSDPGARVEGARLPGARVEGARVEGARVPESRVPGGSAPALTPRSQRDMRVVWSIWAGLGAIATLLIFTKVTSGVVLWALLLATVVIPNPSLQLRQRVVAAAAGTTMVLLVLWLWQYPMVMYVKNVFGLLFDKSAREAFDHPISEVLDIYSRSLSFTGRALVPALIVFALAVATFHRKLRPTGDAGRSRPHDVMTWTLGVLLLIAITALPRMVATTPLTRRDMWSYVGVLAVFIGAAGIIGLAALGADGAVMRGSAAIRSLSVAVAGVAIVAAPFISAVGTNNRLAGELAFAATLWAVVLGIALVRLTQRAAMVRSNARVVPGLVGAVVVLMAGLAVKADIATPYRTAPLLSQGTSSSIPELRGLLLTEADAAWIDWVHASGQSLGAQGVPATAIEAPGALFAFNKSGYANPWLGHQAPVTLNSLRSACMTSPPADLFVLQPGTMSAQAPSVTDLSRSLAGCGIRFPDDFRVVGQRVSADPQLTTTIWRLHHGGRDVRGAAR